MCLKKRRRGNLLGVGEKRKINSGEGGAGMKKKDELGSWTWDLFAFAAGSNESLHC